MNLTVSIQTILKNRSKVNSLCNIPFDVNIFGVRFVSTFSYPHVRGPPLGGYRRLSIKYYTQIYFIYANCLLRP